MAALRVYKGVRTACKAALFTKTNAMKRLTKEEADAMETRPEGRMSWFRGVLIGMPVGEVILLERKEWHQKRAPITVIKSFTNVGTMAWSCKQLANGAGWIIERLR